jgi:hypothetical protein
VTDINDNACISGLLNHCQSTKLPHVLLYGHAIRCDCTFTYKTVKITIENTNLINAQDDHVVHTCEGRVTLTPEYKLFSAIVFIEVCVL